jgi:hypothetical protein
VQEIQSYNNQFYQEWSVTKFVTTYVHVKDNIHSVTSTYDVLCSTQDNFQCPVIPGISYFLKQTNASNQDEFLVAFDTDPSESDPSSRGVGEC